MALLRLIGTGLLVAMLACMAMHQITGDAVWRQRAKQVFRWVVVLALCVIGLFVLRRGAVFI